MPFFSSFTGSFSGGRRRPRGLGLGVGGGGGAATYSLDGATQSATTQLPGGALVYLNYNADGTEVTTTYNSSKQLYTVALPTPYDPTSGVANYDSGDPYEVINITAGNLAGFRYNNDGTKAFFTHQYANSSPNPTSGHISEFSLSTAYDIFSISSSANALYDVTGDWYGSNSFNITDINFNTDGSKMFITNAGGLSALGIFEYDLGTEFDLSTATYSQGFDFATDMPSDILPRFGTFNSAGTKFYMADIREEYVYEFDLSTGFDVSTMSYNGVFLDISGIDTGLRQVGLSQDETQLYVTGAQNRRIYTFDLVQDAGFGGGGGAYSYSNTAYTFDSTNILTGGGGTGLGGVSGGGSGGFSTDVSLDGQYVVKGMPDYDQSSNDNNGLVEIYKIDGGSWTLLQTIAPYTYDGGNSFKYRWGNTVKFTNDGTRLIIDSNGYGSTDYRYGAFFVYDLNESTGLFEFVERHRPSVDASLTTFLRFVEVGEYNRLDITSNGEYVMMQQNTIDGGTMANWVVVYTKDPVTGSYSYTNKHQLPVSSDSSQGNIAISDFGHFVVGAKDSSWQAGAGGIQWAYYDFEADTFKSARPLIVPHPGGGQDVGDDVCMARDGSNFAIKNRILGQVWIFEWDPVAETYSQSQYLNKDDDGLLDQPNTIHLNPDGSQLFVCQSSSVQIWDRDSGTGQYSLTSTLTGFQSSSIYAMSRDSKYLATTGGGIYVYSGIVT